VGVPICSMVLFGQYILAAEESCNSI